MDYGVEFIKYKKYYGLFVTMRKDTNKFNFAFKSNLIITKNKNT
jgi:hypothetical protein